MHQSQLTCCTLSQNPSGETEEAFKNLRSITHAAGGDLDDIIKITVYLTDLSDYPALNKVMSQYFKNTLSCSLYCWSDLATVHVT